MGFERVSDNGCGLDRGWDGVDWSDVFGGGGASVRGFANRAQGRSDVEGGEAQKKGEGLREQH